MKLTYALLALLVWVSACKSRDSFMLSSTAGEDNFDPADAEEIFKQFSSLVESRKPPLNKQRAVFVKLHGCATAQFVIPDNTKQPKAKRLSDRYLQGLFASPATHKAWVRISSDTVPATSDFKNSTIGFSIKVLGVEGKKILPGEEDFKTQDFLLQNHHVFFVDTAKDFKEFTQSIFDGSSDKYLNAHPVTKKILDDMDKSVGNVFKTTYWSTLPYQYGDKDYVKYRLLPCGKVTDDSIPQDDNNYLRTRLEKDLAERGACYELQVQIRKDASMPLDQATVNWSEIESKPMTVATLKIPGRQDLEKNNKACEFMSFTAWHALPAHRPVGSVSKARGIVYKKMADLRRKSNQVPLTEPE